MTAYCPHCGRELSGLTVAARGYCEIHGWQWADWEPVYAPPQITCCESARATGGAYHAPTCRD